MKINVNSFGTRTQALTPSRHTNTGDVSSYPYLRRRWAAPSTSSFIPGKRVLCAKNKGWEDPRTGLDTLEKRKILLSVQVMSLQFVRYIVRNHSLYLLSYPGSYRRTNGDLMSGTLFAYAHGVICRRTSHYVPFIGWCQREQEN